jgi:hypothetical protein
VIFKLWIVCIGMCECLCVFFLSFFLYYSIWSCSEVCQVLKMYSELLSVMLKRWICYFECKLYMVYNSKYESPNSFQFHSFSKCSVCISLLVESAFANFSFIMDRIQLLYFNNFEITLPTFINIISPFLQREGLSRFNKIYEFECNVFNQRCQMIMTSVSGHLLGLEFVGNYRNWRACSPMALFDAPVSKYCPQDYQQIKVLLQCIRPGRDADHSPLSSAEVVNE